MTNTPHELHEEFPEEADKIHAMKVSDAHFARLLDEYHEVNRAVHAAESLTQPTDEAHENDLRRKRMQLKDEIWQLLKSA